MDLEEGLQVKLDLSVESVGGDEFQSLNMEVVQHSVIYLEMLKICCLVLFLKGLLDLERQRGKV